MTKVQQSSQSQESHLNPTRVERNPVTLDPLNQLPVRTTVVLQIEQEIYRALEQNSHFCLLQIDFDRSLSSYDFFSHLSQFLTQKLRQIDTVARYDDDQILLVLPQYTLSQGYNLGLSLQKQINDEFNIQIFIGGVVFPSDGSTVSELLLRCRFGNYEARSKALNTPVFFSTLNPLN